MQSRNLAARAGRWSAAHRKPAIFGWLALVVVSLAIGGAVGTNTIKDEDQGNGQSRQAQKAINDNFPKKGDENVLVQSRSGDVKPSSPQFRAAVKDVVGAVGTYKTVSEIQTPYERGNQGQLSRDGRSALVTFSVAGDSDLAKKRIGPIEDSVAKVASAHPELRIEEFGSASASKALQKAFSDDFSKAEVTSVPITLIILVIAFGALVAAGIPLLLGLSAVAIAIGLVALPSQIFPVDDAVTSVILLVGLAVGVDYTLFILRREREERVLGRSPDEALRVASATSGRAVLVSGLTVMVAMAGMFFTGSNVFTGFGIGTILVVAAAMLGSVTVVPALLSWLGDRVQKGRVPFLAKWREQRQARGAAGAWGWILDRVLARPVVSAVLSAGVLIALAIPALGLHTAAFSTDGLPRSLPIMQTYDRIQAAFPGSGVPAVVAVQASDVTSPKVVGQMKALERRALATGEFKRPVFTSVSPNHRVVTMDLPMVGSGTDDRSEKALAELRGRLIPATVGTVDGAKTYVTGQTAGSKDFNDVMKSHAPLVFAFVLLLAFILLLVTFRSIVIPIKAIILNLLSIGAAYGILVLIFQDGHLESLVGFTSIGGVTNWLPLFLFVVLFGLSMDYHVFILSRVRELYDRGMSTDEAVKQGITTTAGTVTSAAIVMVGVFSVFITLSFLDFKELGVGMAVAVLIDATIIRGILLPASMKLLGDWNWYLPSWLEWLPRVGAGRDVLPPHGPDEPPTRDGPGAPDGPRSAPVPV
jgi:RND superfamily putative drug exporter